MKERSLVMPYHKDKQQAFQAAEQGFIEAQDIYNEIVVDSKDYGQQLKHLKNEVNEALQQIENALEVASETQRKRLRQYQNALESIIQELNETD